MRALIPALVDWIAAGKTPPASQYPTIAAGTAVAPTRAATGFPDLSDVMVPNGPAAKPRRLHVEDPRYNAVFVTDYSSAIPVADLARPYTEWVPKVDANGNATTGVQVPDIKVPLATYTGWSYRAPRACGGRELPVGGQCDSACRQQGGRARRQG